MTVLLVNITGPDGKQRQAGEPVPKSWDADYVKSLVKSGGAGTQKAWDEIDKANAAARQANIDVEAAELAGDYEAGRLPATVGAVLNGGGDPERIKARLRAVFAGRSPEVVDAFIKAAGGEAK